MVVGESGGLVLRDRLESRICCMASRSGEESLRGNFTLDTFMSLLLFLIVIVSVIPLKGGVVLILDVRYVFTLLAMCGDYWRYAASRSFAFHYEVNFIVVFLFEASVSIRASALAGRRLTMMGATSQLSSLRHVSEGDVNVFCCCWFFDCGFLSTDGNPILPLFISAITCASGRLSALPKLASIGFVRFTSDDGDRTIDVDREDGKAVARCWARFGA